MANKLLELVDEEVWGVVEEMGGRPNFALSWILTWFAHDFKELNDV